MQPFLSLVCFIADVYKGQSRPLMRPLVGSKRPQSTLQLYDASCCMLLNTPSTQPWVYTQAHMHVSLSFSRLSFLDNSHHDKSSSSTLQHPHAYSAFSNAGDHKMLCWCCSQFCVQRYMGTVGWMGLRGGPCYLLAVSWPSLAKLSCTCTASSWKLSDRGERRFHHDD